MTQYMLILRGDTSVDYSDWSPEKMQQVIEGHVRYHVVDPHQKLSSEQEQATEELLAVLRAYLR